MKINISLSFPARIDSEKYSENDFLKKVEQQVHLY